MKFRLDPFPKFTQDVLRSVLNARIIIFSVVIAKITLDRLYKYAVIVNPLSIDETGEATLDVLEYQNVWTGEQVFRYLNNYGTKGRLAYQSYLLYDCVFVLARTIPICLICTWAYKKAPEAIRPGVWVPLLNMVTDLIENVLLLVLIKLFPTRLDGLNTLVAYVIQFKALTFKITIGIMFISLFVGIYYAFHTVLADSVVMEKERKEKLAARDQVQDVLKKSAARRATQAAAGGRSKKVD
ncbi:hypothetical protein K501DRAFT_284050 [Backusella circina FSU 941]|nr:hypothetical protein K501DRAFT_284050 [Backusella circina FSU 941]